jgi:Ser/Thr protein kinase RdoA (MazF antagonist)
VDDEVLALSAAAGVAPVPRVLDRVDLDGCSGVLLECLPGRPAAELALSSPNRASQIGVACGALHAQLSGILAPAGLRRVGPSRPGLRPRLLHLDLHPFNVLVDDGGEVTGIIDWANAAAGDPVLDRARSWSILTLDPGAVARRSEAQWVALSEGWETAGQLVRLSAWARAWAAEFMLEDLALRHSTDELKLVAEALDDARAELSGQQPTGRGRS